MVAIASFVLLALVKPWGGVPATDRAVPSIAEASDATSPSPAPTSAPGPAARVVSTDRACVDLEAVEAATSPGSAQAGGNERPFARPPRTGSLVALRADAGGRYDLASVPASAHDMQAIGISRLTDWRIPGPPLATLLSSPVGGALALTFYGSADCTEPVVIRRDGTIVAPFAPTPGRPVVPIGWAPSGRQLAAIVGGLGLAIWDASSGSVMTSGLPCFACGPVTSAAWSRDGSRIAALFTRPCPARDGCDWFGLATFIVGTERLATFEGWRVQDSSWLDEVQHGERATVLGWVDAEHVALALGARVAVVAVDPTATGRFVALRAQDPVLSPDGRTLAWAVRDGTQVTAVEVARIVDVAPGGSGLSSASGGSGARGASNGSVRVWSAPKGRVVGGIAVLAWSPDSRRLGIGLRDEVWIGGAAGGFVRVPETGLPIAALAW